MSVNEKMTAIADAIRSKTGDTEKLGLDAMASGVDNVYTAGHIAGYIEGEGYGRKIGYDEGHTAGYTEGEAYGYTEGQQAEYDRFWDEYQSNGYRGNYDGGFHGNGWTNKLFKPKYDLHITRCMDMFSLTCISGDLVQLCESLGVIMDFSECQYFNNFASNAFFITRFGVIDMRKAVDGYPITFTNCRELTTIDELKFAETTALRNDMFFNCSKLANVTFSGTIAKSGLNLGYSTAWTHESLMSCLNSLKDYSGTSATNTVMMGATNLAKLTAAEKAIATQKGWTLA